MVAKVHDCPQAARPFVSKVEGKMGYEDFVWFILSEEDKTNDVALEYWFRQGPAMLHKTLVKVDCCHSTKRGSGKNKVCDVKVERP